MKYLKLLIVGCMITPWLFLVGISVIADYLAKKLFILCDRLFNWAVKDL